MDMKWKRLTAMFLCAVMLFGMMPVQATSSQTEWKAPAAKAEAESISASITYINPLYEDEVTASDLKQSEESGIMLLEEEDVEYLTDTEELADLIRPQLVARDETIVVYYQTDDSDMITQENLQAYMITLMETAMKHTGVSNEGDYLRWQYATWQGGAKGSGSNGLYKLTLTYTITYYTTAEQEAKVDSAVNTLLRDLDLSGETDYKKLAEIYDYICKNVTYDYTNLNDKEYKLKHTAYAALLNGTAVCQGYAVLLYRLALELGVDCRLIPGKSSAGEEHGWNIAKLGDVYYNLDATWDAGKDTYSNFLCGSDAFDEKHIRWDDYNTAEFHASYPMSQKTFALCDGEASGSAAHSYEIAVTEPTCTEQGYTTYTCVACCDSYTDDYTDAIGHTYTDVTTEPTCEEQGYTTHTCTTCGYSYMDAYTDAIGHQYQSFVTKPTCTEGGYTTHTCAACGDEYVDTKTEATGHNYKAVVTEPTCTESGYTTHTCSACGDSYTDAETDALGHSYEQGTCVVCGHMILYVAAPEITASNVASSGKIRLTWDAVENAKTYEVYRAVEDGDTYTRMKTVSGTTYTNTSAKAGTTYRYYVVAVAENGTTSEASNIESCTCDLAQPTISLSNVASSGKIKISWEAVEDADAYEVYRATSEDGEYVILNTVTGTSLTNTSATTGKAYYYKVKATTENPEADSAFSAVKYRTCDLPRPVVTASNIASSGKVKLAWDAVDGATKYTLYVYDTDGELLKSASTTKTTINHNSAVAGTTYTYKVRALCDVSAATSAYSSAKDRTCDLARPTVKVSNIASTGKVKLTWDAVDGAAKYTLYIYDEDGELLKSSNTTKTTINHNSAVAGKTYTYKVKAKCDVSSATSAYSSAKERTCDLARPVVKITRTDAGKPKLTWNAVDGASKYKVYRSTTGKDGTFSLQYTTTGTGYANTGAVSGTTYYYKVIAVHQTSAANSAYSAVVHIKAQ